MKNSYEQMGPSIQEEEGISFKDILATIKKHLVAIILFLGVSAVGGFVGAHVRDAVSPTYSANATIMVAYSNTDAINQSAYSYSNSIAETVASFIKDDAVLTSVAEDFKVTTKEIRNNLTVNQKSGNLIISLSYTSDDRETAANILNDIVLTSKATADKVVNNGTEDEPVHPFLYKNISLLTSADVNKVSKESHTFKYTAIGAALGVVLAFIYVFFFEMFNNSFKSRDDVERTLNVPLLGVVPHYEIDPNKQEGGKK